MLLFVTSAPVPFPASSSPLATTTSPSKQPILSDYLLAIASSCHTLMISVLSWSMGYQYRKPHKADAGGVNPELAQWEIGREVGHREHCSSPADYLGLSSFLQPFQMTTDKTSITLSLLDVAPSKTTAQSWRDTRRRSGNGSGLCWVSFAPLERWPTSQA